MTTPTPSEARRVENPLEVLQNFVDVARLAVNFHVFQAHDDNEVVRLRESLKEAAEAIRALRQGGEA